MDAIELQGIEINWKVLLALVIILAVFLMVCICKPVSPTTIITDPLKDAKEIVIQKGGSTLKLDMKTRQLELLNNGRLVATSNKGLVTMDEYNEILDLAGWNVDDIQRPLNGRAYSYLELARVLVETNQLDCEYIAKNGLSCKIPNYQFVVIDGENL